MFVSAPSGNELGPLLAPSGNELGPRPPPFPQRSPGSLANELAFWASVEASPSLLDFDDAVPGPD
eukprot:13348592-Heterocapsa_arctica.AAC.1